MKLADAYAQADGKSCTEDQLRKHYSELRAALQEFAAEKAGEPIGHVMNLLECAEAEPHASPRLVNACRSARAALDAPQPAQESIECDCGRIHKKTAYGWGSSEPAQPVAQPLTDLQIAQAWIGTSDPMSVGGKFSADTYVREFVRAIERAHGIVAKE